MQDPERTIEESKLFIYFVEAMNEWGLNGLLTAEMSKNALNCCEIMQSIPLLRIARYGFMASPEPTDLAGLLNANALYSFATGFIQLVIGILLCQSHGVTVTKLVPLGVSTASLLLSFGNVLLNFAGALCEIENEQQEAHRIMGRLQAGMDEERQQTEDRNKKALRIIQDEFEGKDSPDFVLLKRERNQEQGSLYNRELSDLNEKYGALTRTELTAWKQGLAEKKDILNGKLKVKSNPGGTQAMQVAEQHRKMWLGQRTKIEDHFQKSLEGLDPAAPTFSVDMQNLVNGRTTLMQAVHAAEANCLGNGKANEAVIHHAV